MQLKIYSNDCQLGQSAESRVFMELWNVMLDEHLREFKYMAEMASLELGTSLYYDNYMIYFAGYNDSLLNYIGEAMRMVRSMDVSKMEKTYNSMVEKKLKEWSNFYFATPY